MQLRAPAKINLSLRVLRRRADGFHEIETFITLVSVYDELQIERRPDGISFECDDASVPQGDDNLVVIAARTFFATTRIDGGVAIRLRKKIPHAAGLGGGSSDAATTLLGLDQLFETELPREALARMAQPIGSDVPFFLIESAALCRGRGELVSPEKMSEKLPLLLLKPQFGVAASWAYSKWQHAEKVPAIYYAEQQHQGHTFVNDLEPPVFQKFLFLAELKRWLLNQPEVAIALMSGSGSTIFAVLKRPKSAEGLAGRAREELDPNLWTCGCETI